MCKKYLNVIVLFIIILIASLFRIICINKTGGLWYDELVSFKEASQSNIVSVILYTLKNDVHLPVYPVLLHIWAKLFSFNDLSLRLFSAIFGILTVIVAYFAGKEINSSYKTGLFCSLVFAFNSFLIYYSQEVRLYSLLIFLTTLLSLFALKLKNSQKKLILGISLAFTAWLIVHTYTIAFLYIIPVFILLYYYFGKKKNSLVSINISFGLFILLSLPTCIYMMQHYTNYTNQINGYYCDWSSLFVVFQDMFSPILEGLLNNPEHYMSYLFNNMSPKIFMFIILPILISLFVIAYAIKKNKQVIVILIPSIFFLLAEIIAFKFTNFKILPRYVSIAIPNILLIFGFGLAELYRFRRVNIIIAVIFFLINGSYLIFSNNAAYKLPRNGFRAVSELINQQNLTNGDYVIVWNRTEVLDKYVDTKNLIVLGLLRDFAYRSELILDNESKINRMSLDERKTFLRSYFADLRPAKNSLLLMSFILNKMKVGQKFVITSNNYFDKFSPEAFLALVNDDASYKQMSYNDLLTIKSLITVKEICAYNLNFVGRYEKEGSVIFVFEK